MLLARVTEALLKSLRRFLVAEALLLLMTFSALVPIEFQRYYASIG
jgi:hypothetical protein